MLVGSMAIGGPPGGELGLLYGVPGENVPWQGSPLTRELHIFQIHFQRKALGGAVTTV
jgi:hypothetical protein